MRLSLDLCVDARVDMLADMRVDILADAHGDMLAKTLEGMRVGMLCRHARRHILQTCV